MKLIHILSVLLLACSSLPTYSMQFWHHRRDDIPSLLRPTHAPHAAEAVPHFLRSGAVIGSIACIGAFYRLYNKPHDVQHFSLLQTLNPVNIITHPLRCIDDGLVGHTGSGSAHAYGVLGTTFSLVPRVESTINAVDQTKRKVEVCFEWVNRNIAQISAARPHFSAVARHAEERLLHYYNTIGNLIA